MNSHNNRMIVSLWNILTIFGKVYLRVVKKLMQQVLIRMEAIKFFEDSVKNKPRLKKLKYMYLIRREHAYHDKSK